MGKRKFFISINERGFDIIEEIYKDVDLTERDDVDWTSEYFGSFFLKNAKVIEISDTQKPRENEITECADDTRLHEDIEYKAYFYGEKKPFHQFEGNFIEALIWLNKNWDEWYPQDER